MNCKKGAPCPLFAKGYDVKIKFKRLDVESSFEIPKQQTQGAAGFDLRYVGTSPLRLNAIGQMVEVDLGFAMELPPGCEAQIRPRSGLAVKHGVTVVNSPGTIDADYRGPVKAFLVKTAQGIVIDGKVTRLPDLVINPGDRVCQMVIHQLPHVVELLEVTDLSNTDRAEGGFGSTGVK
jgi:dUTP pyrophosphatase